PSWSSSTAGPCTRCRVGSSAQRAGAESGGCRGRRNGVAGRRRGGGSRRGVEQGVRSVQGKGAAMVRRGRFRTAWLLGVLGAALGAACNSSTSPHQPTPCPTYSGGLSTGDSLFGLYHLVSYCLYTLPAYGPPVDTGHVTLTKFDPADSFIAVIAT